MPLRRPISRIRDISPLISRRTAVFPGDVAFDRRVSAEVGTGSNYSLSSITLSVHTGAHADAPNHYHAEGVGIDQRDLEPYLGPCVVIEVRLPRGERIRPEHLPYPMEHIDAPRVLFKTRSFPDSERWVSDYNSLSPELITALAESGVKLVGIDTPSIDPDTAKDLESHLAVYRANLSILEGLVLDDVPEGRYTLVALPLKLEGADASPVRAVLLEET